MLERQPNDPFLLYGMAMEFKKTGDLTRSLEYLSRVLAAEATNCAAWMQLGQVHELNREVESAKHAYGQGIRAAGQIGDRHAAEEMREYLEVLEGQ